MFENCEIFAGFPMALEVWMAAVLEIGCSLMPFVYNIFTLRDCFFFISKTWLFLFYIENGLQETYCYFRGISYVIGYNTMPFVNTILPFYNHSNTSLPSVTKQINNLMSSRIWNLHFFWHFNWSFLYLCWQNKTLGKYVLLFFIAF